MKHLVPSLSALALVSLTAGALSAATISPKEENLTIAINGQLQTRLTLFPQGTYNNADAYGQAQSGYTAPATFTSAGDGVSYDPLRGQPGEPEKARFDMRRVRLGVVASYKDGWRGGIVLSGDKQDSNYYSQRPIALYSAWVSKKFNAASMDNEVMFGLEKPYTAESSISSATSLFPTNRPAGDFVDIVRGVGAHYRLYGSMFTLAGSFMNGLSTAIAGNGANGIGQEGTPGYYASVRAEFAPGASMMPKKKAESYVGAEGTHILIGAEVDKEWDRQVAVFAGQTATAGAWNQQDSLIYGPDVLVHAGGLSALAEYKRRTTTWEGTADFGQDVPNADSRHSQVWNIQAGYALPLSGGMVVEPAVRYADIDMDTNADEYSNYGRGVDYTGLATVDASANTNGGARSSLLSGQQIEVGVNLYISGISNKLQLSYLNWQAERGIGDAQMLILQHQLTF